jgi:hypothetical protein
MKNDKGMYFKMLYPPNDMKMTIFILTKSILAICLNNLCSTMHWKKVRFSWARSSEKTTHGDFDDGLCYNRLHRATLVWVNGLVNNDLQTPWPLQLSTNLMQGYS